MAPRRVQYNWKRLEVHRDLYFWLKEVVLIFLICTPQDQHITKGLVVCGAGRGEFSELLTKKHTSKEKRRPLEAARIKLSPKE